MLPWNDDLGTWWDFFCASLPYPSGWRSFQLKCHMTCAAESAPAESAPAESAPAESAPAESAPAESAVERSRRDLCDQNRAAIAGGATMTEPTRDIEHLEWLILLMVFQRFCHIMNPALGESTRGPTRNLEQINETDRLSTHGFSTGTSTGCTRSGEDEKKIIIRSLEQSYFQVQYTSDFWNPIRSLRGQSVEVGWLSPIELEICSIWINM